MSDDFINSITNFIHNTTVDVGELRINVQKELVASVISDTRVDTGLARRNWQVGRDSIPTSIIEYSGSPTAGGASAVSDGQAKAFSEDGVFYLVNNLHYVYYLEFGTSKTVGDGMARRNSKRIADNLRAQYG